MSNILFNNNKKHVGTPEDEVYLKPQKCSCWLCVNKTGRRKTYLNLWQLHYHLKFHHKNENYQQVEEQLFSLIKMGVLR